MQIASLNFVINRNSNSPLSVCIDGCNKCSDAETCETCATGYCLNVDDDTCEGIILNLILDLYVIFNFSYMNVYESTHESILFIFSSFFIKSNYEE